MSARSPDWRSGANPSGVGPDAFSDATRASGGLTRAFARSPCLLSCRTYPHRAASRTHARDALRSSSVNSTCAPTTTVLRVLTASTPINTTLRHCLPTRAGAWGTEEGGVRPTSRGVVSEARSNLRRLNVNALAFDAREFSRLSCHVGRHLRFVNQRIMLLLSVIVPHYD